MGRITTGVGLISGLNISELVDNLLAIEGRPINLLAQRISTANAQRTALEDLSAKLLALQLTNSSLASSSIYSSRTATSSNPAALSATATTLAALGTYQVRPVRLSQPQQFVSSGLATREATPVGAGTITVKLGGYVSTSTPLDSLNGGLGVSRGKLTITDRSGASAVIDLTAAVSVTDVLTAINSTSTIRVEASVQGDTIVIADKTGATASNLTVQEVGSGTTAAGLGLLGSVAGNTLVGADIVKLSPSLRLGFLNDANGVRKAPGVADFRITLRACDFFNFHHRQQTTYVRFWGVFGNKITGSPRRQHARRRSGSGHDAGRRAGGDQQPCRQRRQADGRGRGWFGPPAVDR